MRGARCFRTGTRSIPHSGAVTDEQRSRWPDAAPPRAGALWLAGFVAHSSQTAAGMLWCPCGSTSRLASKPKSLQQNRNLFLSGPLALDSGGLVVARASRPCVGRTVRTGGTPVPGVWTFSPCLSERDNDGSRGLEPTDRGQTCDP